MPKKFTVLGIDGGTFTLIRPLMERGLMPNLKSMTEKGVWAHLKSTIPNHTAAAWSSFATGRNPGSHGVFEWVRHSPGRTEIEIVDSRNIKATTFYELLEENGYTCCLINLPLSFPPRINGPVIGSVITRGEFVHPVSLKSEIDFNEYKRSPTNKNLIFSPTENLIDIIERKMKIAKILFKRDFDFFFMLFSESDTVQHLFFDKMLDAIKKGKFSKYFKVFQKIDECIGWFMEQNSRRNTMIISDHGFKYYPKVFYINYWLKKNDMVKESRERNIRMFWGGDNPVVNLANRHPGLRRALLRTYQLTEYLNPLPKNVLNRMEGHLSEGIDLERSKVFCPSSELGCIYINDHRFKGVVSKEEVEKIRLSVIEDLRNCGYIHKAYPKENYYSGDSLVSAPDILIEKHDYYISRNLVGREIGQCHMNNHDKIGIFFAQGPDIVEEKTFRAPTLYDLAPTLLAYFGVPIPKGIDGRVLETMFKPDVELKIVEQKDKYKRLLVEKDLIKNAIKKINQ
jgi:predicted AlkP superfamily phosphohydrolase/phosphomutase